MGKRNRTYPWDVLMGVVPEHLISDISGIPRPAIRSRRIARRIRPASRRGSKIGGWANAIETMGAERIAEICRSIGARIPDQVQAALDGVEWAHPRQAERRGEKKFVERPRFGQRKPIKAAGFVATGLPRAPEAPTRRSQCADGPRPCPWVGCRYHLAVDITTTGVLVADPRLLGDDPAEYLAQLPSTCALDVAEVGPVTLDAAGAALDVSRSRIDQIEQVAQQLVKLRTPKWWRELVTDGPEGFLEPEEGPG